MTITAGDVADNFDTVRQRITNAGGNPNEIRVVAVTKKFEADAVTAAQACGIDDVAENYAQEARSKYEDLEAAAKPQPQWHFVGQLQRNKVRLLASFTDLWQSVDSLPLIDEIARRVPSARIMVQVNLANEEGRGGCTWGEVHTLVDHARASGLGVAGLMGVASLDSQAQTRREFRRLRKMTDELGLPEISMGMSHDLEIAVEEGTTMLRIGSALFGPRD